MKKGVFLLLALALAFGSAEITVRAALLYLNGKHLGDPLAKRAELGESGRVFLRRLIAGGFSHMRLDPELGWVNHPGSNLEQYYVNVDGIRAGKNYPSEPVKKRICAFGDSFTFGTELPRNADTWPQRLEERLGKSFEVLNFGVAGYGNDQALLLYRRQSRKYRCHLVLIGVLADDINRNVSVLRTFMSAEPLAKPRFRLRGEGLELLPNPLPTREDYRDLLQHERSVLARLAKSDFHGSMLFMPSFWDFLATVRLVKAVWYHVQLASRGFIWMDGVVYPPSEAYRVSLRILQEFSREVRSAGAVPVFLFFPGDLQLLRRDQGYPLSYAPLAMQLADEGQVVWDTGDAFTGRANYREFYAPGGHFNPVGAKVVADFVAGKLRGLKL